MTKLVLEIVPTKKVSMVRVRIPAGSIVAPSLQNVTVSYGKDTQTRRRVPESATVIEFTSLQETQKLTIDFGGPMPAGTLILPEQTGAIVSPIPPLVDDTNATLTPFGAIWHPKYPPAGLKSIVSSLFAHNTHLVALPGTFARLPLLTTVPESLFFPLIYLKSFAGVFALSGLTEVSRQLFTANLQAEDFTESFAGCKNLKKVPEDLFSTNAQAHIFDRLFAESGLSEIPEKIFWATRKHGSFIETFARSDVSEIPAGLMKNLEPSNVDGMFEPARILDHDPMHLKSACRFPSQFLADTLRATGVPTKHAYR